mgnify:CR=1 FL=1
MLPVHHAPDEPTALAAAVVAFPLVFKSARAAFEGVEGQLEKAARTLGASGVGPERGLYTAIIAGFLISALGGSRFQIGGPAGRLGRSCTFTQSFSVVTIALAPAAIEVRVPAPRSRRRRCAAGDPGRSRR